MLNFSQQRATGKMLNKNPTPTIVTSDLRKMRTHKSVFLLKKDIPLKTMIQFVLSEPIKSDKMMKLIRNSSLKSVQLSKRLKLLSFKKNSTYLSLLFQNELLKFGTLREKIRIEQLSNQASKALITFTSIEAGENALKNFNVNLDVVPQRTFVLRPFASK